MRRFWLAAGVLYVAAVCTWAVVDQFHPTDGPWFAAAPASYVLFPLMYYTVDIPLDLLFGGDIDPNPSTAPSALGVAMTVLIWAVISASNAALFGGGFWACNRLRRRCKRSRVQLSG